MILLVSLKTSTLFTYNTIGQNEGDAFITC